MRNRFLKVVIFCLTSLVLLIAVLPVSAEENTRTADEAQSFIDGIVAYKLKESGASSIQQWIDGAITTNAGFSSEWYAIALSQNGKYDFSLYEDALLKYISENKIASASSRQKYALALIAAGSTDSYIYNTLNDSIGKQGVMSWIFGLNLLNNGYESNEYSLSDVKQKLLSLALSDGGWSVMGSYSDVDVTAMAVQALAPYYKSDSAVKSAVDKALTLLSACQKDTGDYANYGVNNPESTAQVLVALSSLGIDCKTDDRFIKNGNTLFDGIELYCLSDGSFCHKQGGGYNATSTVQVFYSMVSYLRMQEGKSALYLLDARNPDELKIPDNTTTQNPTETTSSENRDTSVSESSSKPSSSGSIESAASSASAQGNNSSEVTTGDRFEAENSSEVNEQNYADDTIAYRDDKAAEEKEYNSNYKLWVSIAVIIIAVIICAVLYLLKKRDFKNFIVVVCVAATTLAIVLLTDIQTADNYYKNVGFGKENVIGTVTLTIRCDTIQDKTAEHIPDDGSVLDVAEFDIEDGDTVYDILLEATSMNKIHLETNGSGQAIYVEGISNIYEFDFGDLSGWMYCVNGESPSISCGEYKLTDKDKIEWLYSCDLGNDLE